MDITKCLTISTAHITQETKHKVEFEELLNKMGLIVYKKGRVGYWIYIPDDFIESDHMEIPFDLWKCMLVAYENDCRWLCLDRDGMEIKLLPTYDW